MATTTAPPRAAEAYEATAPVYDAFTAHHDHEAWTRMLEPLLRPHGLSGPGRLLDVGCGTGKSLLPWEARGWSVVACDVSPSMLEQAAAKAGPATTTLLADARDLPRLGAFDLVTLADDVVNYLAPEEHAAAFAGVARNLAAGGLAVFDLNTVAAFRSFFASTEVLDEVGVFAVWRGRATTAFEPGDVAEATLDGFVEREDGAWERHRSHHLQHHHPIDRVAAALESAGLELCAVHGTNDDCTNDPHVDELRHAKAVVIARRRPR